MIEFISQEEMFMPSGQRRMLSIHEQEFPPDLQEPLPLYARDKLCPLAIGLVCVLWGHLHIFVLQFLQQLQENIRSGSALVDLPRQGFSSSLFLCGMKPII